MGDLTESSRSSPILLSLARAASDPTSSQELPLPFHLKQLSLNWDRILLVALLESDTLKRSLQYRPKFFGTSGI